MDSPGPPPLVTNELGCPLPALLCTHKLQVQRGSCLGFATGPSVSLAKLSITTVPQIPILEASGRPGYRKPSFLSSSSFFFFLTPPRGINLDPVSALCWLSRPRAGVKGWGCLCLGRDIRTFRAVHKALLCGMPEPE